MGHWQVLLLKNIVPVLTGDFVKHVFQKFCVFLIQFEGIPVCCGSVQAGEKEFLESWLCACFLIKIWMLSFRGWGILGSALLTKHKMNLYSGFHTLTHNRVPSCLIPRRPHRNKYFAFCSSTAFAKTSHGSFESGGAGLVIPFTRCWMRSQCWGKLLNLCVLFCFQTCVLEGGEY